MTRVRHRKRGAIYSILGEAEMQVSTGWPHPNLRNITEGEKVTVYRCEETGKLYARLSDEFSDGRFEPITDEFIADMEGEDA